MYDEIGFILDQMGYSKLELNAEEPHINIKLVQNNIYADNEGYVIITLDETSGIIYTDGQLGHISGQVREFLMDKGCSLFHFLYIFISNRNTPPQGLQNNNRGIFHIIPSKRALIIYGDVLPMYEGLKKPIEEYLAAASVPGYAQVAADKSGQYSNLPAPANTAIVIINVVIFILSDFLPSVTDAALVIDRYSLSWDMVINNGQYYRIITSMFMHYGADHIFNNMVVLLFIGSYIEQYLGKAKYLTIYFLSGIIAGCTSMVYNIMQHSYTPSVGASGAIFGMMGSLLVILLVHRRQAYELGIRRVLFMVFLSLYGGFTSQGVDNAAHIGGFLGGMAVTLIILGINRHSGRKAGINL